MIPATRRTAWFREPRVLAAAGLCLLAFLGNRIVTWILDTLGMSQFHRQASFILHVVGCTSEAASDMPTVFQPSPVFSESYFTSRVNFAT